MIKTELNQISPIENRFKLYSSLSNDNLGLYIASDIPLDETAQDIPLNEDEIEPAVLDQI